MHCQHDLVIYVIIWNVPQDQVYNYLWIFLVFQLNFALDSRNIKIVLFFVINIADVEEGALLPSPTREKLMPAITKRESESQRGSPKKTAASRHGSPQKGSPQKGSPKKVLKCKYFL